MDVAAGECADVDLSGDEAWLGFLCEKNWLSCWVPCLGVRAGDFGCVLLFCSLLTAGGCWFRISWISSSTWRSTPRRDQLFETNRQLRVPWSPLREYYRCIVAGRSSREYLPRYRTTLRSDMTPTAAPFEAKRVIEKQWKAADREQAVVKSTEQK